MANITPPQKQRAVFRSAPVDASDRSTTRFLAKHGLTCCFQPFESTGMGFAATSAQGQGRAARVGAVVALLVLLYVSLLIPGIVATSVLAAVLFALVVMEKRWPTFASWGGTQLAGDEG